MRIGVCGIACEKCPRRTAGQCPNGPDGCRPRENKFCAIATCAHAKGRTLCFECPEFPCPITAQGPIAAGYCGYIAMKS